MTVMGCGAAAPTPYFLTTSQLVNIHDQLILIDCGEGTQLTLRKSSAKFHKIKTILISHMHGDHTLGLPGLIASMNLLGRNTALNIYGPDELEDMVRKVWHLTGTHIEFNVYFHKLNTEEKTPIFETESYIVESFPTKHRIPTCGFIISEKERGYSLKPNARKKYSLTHLEIQILKRGEDVDRGEEVIKNSSCCSPPVETRSYAFAADSAYSPKVVEAVKGCSLLYHEATFEAKDANIAKKTQHSTSKDAARVAIQANVGQLLLGHYSNRYRDLSTLLSESQDVFKNSYLSVEGRTYSIE